jgi:DNA-binding transcriptional regulator YiaG
MTHAYDRICLDRAADTLGRMLDYSVYSLHYDIAAMIDLFIASGIAALFERGDIRIIAGMSGVELSYEVLEKSGIAFERTQPRYTKSLSPEYWSGYTLAHIQWETGLSFEQIIKGFSPQLFITEYSVSRLSFLDSLPLDLDGGERSAKLIAFGRQFAEEALLRFTSTADGGNDPFSDETPLKKMRIKNGLSQSGLAKASGVPLRTIQQYEQRQKDLSRARSEYLIALSRALGCDPSRLI